MAVLVSLVQGSATSEAWKGKKTSELTDKQKARINDKSDKYKDAADRDEEVEEVEDQQKISMDDILNPIDDVKDEIEDGLYVFFTGWKCWIFLICT